jgi:ATP-dependent helicase/nuclease subunit B
MIITGMNDEYIPGGQLSDIFLPDTLRHHLGLRNDADRLAANAYIMQALIKPRLESGRISFITGKTDALGNPLHPSRLFFKCSDQELPERARKLFANPREERANYPLTTSFLLRANLPQDISYEQTIITSMSATKFKDYLACPFRFYLKYLLEMNELSDEKMEMDALDFGSLVHDVINNLFKDRGYYQNRTEQEIIAYLDRAVDNWLERRFGRGLPLQLEFQRVSAKQRLRAAVHVQLELWEQGWEIIETELSLTMKIDGMLIQGQIDRIDRNNSTGMIRIIDYKTSDRVNSPESAHLSSLQQDDVPYSIVKGKNRRWKDLQLPLYLLLLSERDDLSEGVDLCYFNLPKAVGDVGLSFWEKYTNEIADSARTCAQGIINDIRAWRFWPPKERVEYDNYEKIFADKALNSVDAAALEDCFHNLRGNQ